MSVLLYTLVTFTCKGTGDKLFWTIDGDEITDSIQKYRDVSVTTNNTSLGVWSSVLTIKALPTNDGIDVTCTVFSQDLSHSQKGAGLSVKGQSNV